MHILSILPLLTYFFIVCAHDTKKIDAVFAAWDKPDSPGCILTILKDGHPVYARGYGMANLEHNIPISSSSVFHVASISKQFTAMSILLLEQKGMLSLDDDIRMYIPEIPNFGHRITIHHLIHHTSGLRDQWELLSLAGWRANDLKTEEDILELVAHQKELNFNPGTEHLYCNTGYTLMAVIIKRITGQSLRQFANEHIFQPLAMKNTHFYEDHTEVVRNRTSAYINQKDNNWVISIPLYDTTGATNLYTTAEDLARWDQNFYDKYVGGEAVINKMHHLIHLNNGEQIQYACGLIIGSYRGLKTVSHSGSDAGYRSYFVRFPEERLSIICLCNTSTINPIKLSMQVADIVLQEQFSTSDFDSKPICTPSESTILDKIGIYISKSTHILKKIFIKDGKLMIAYPTDELLAISEDHFHAARSLTQYIFQDNATPSFHETNASNDLASPTVFEKIESIQLLPMQLHTYVGNFYSAELDTTYSFVIEGEELLIRRKKNKDVKLLPIYHDTFYIDEIGYLHYTRDTKDTISGFVLHTPRIRHLRFTKIS